MIVIVGQIPDLPGSRLERLLPQVLAAVAIIVAAVVSRAPIDPESRSISIAPIIRRIVTGTVVIGRRRGPAGSHLGLPLIIVRIDVAERLRRPLGRKADR